MAWPRFRNPFRRTEQNSVLSNPDQWLIEAILGGLSTAAGVTVTPLKAIGIATVFACVNRISGSIGSSPLKLYKRLPDGGSVEATEHPLYSLMLDSPNPEMTSVDFKGAMQTNATMRQNGHGLIVRDGFGEVAEIWPIEPQDISMLRDPATQDVKYYLRGKEVPSRSILHLKGFTANGVIGLDTITAAREVIALAIALQDNAARFFSNGSRPGVILEHPQRLSDQAAKRLRESFDALFKGTGNAYKTVVAEEGMKVALQRQDNRSSQFQEARLAQAKELCQIFGVPPHKVGILDEANFSTIEQQNIEYVSDTITPWARRWEQSCAMKLLRPEERGVYFFRFDLGDLLRGDMASRYDAYATARNWGFMCVDEIREREGMNPLPDGKGKIFLEPLNMQETDEDDPDQGDPAPTGAGKKNGANGSNGHGANGDDPENRRRPRISHRNRLVLHVSS